jgi:integrase/recombinase XerD
VDEFQTGFMTVFSEAVDKVKIWLLRQGYSKYSIKGYVNDLKYFFKWLEKNKIQLELLNQSHIDYYQKSISNLKIKKTTIQGRLYIIKLYDKYLQLTSNRKILYKDLRILESEIKSDREILTVEEIKKLYAATDESLLGYRDRAILALFYGCGLRKREVERLECKDICFESGLLHVKPGKNYCNRFVPMSSGVIKDLKDYEKFSRRYLAFADVRRYIVGLYGKAINGEQMRFRVKKLLDKTNINKNISLHNLRHSIATHLLQAGMSLEQIGVFLGHRSLDSTQIYAHVDQGK